MATVNFSAADRTLYAYLAGEIDHDAAQNLRIQLDEALVSRDTGNSDHGFFRCRVYGFLRRGADPGPAAAGAGAGGSLRIQHAPDQLRRVLQLAQIPCNDVQQKEE